MTQEEIFKLRDSAEKTRVQFKERITRDNKYDVSCEMVALSNSHGGYVVVGIDDKTGVVNPLSWIFIFDDRVEIHSPGELPNGLTVEDIMKGTSMPRNEFLFINANYLLPYTGAGTGIIRAMEEKPDVTFESMESAHEFVTVVRRKVGASNQESNQASNQESNQGTNGETNGETNQVKPVKVQLTGSQKDIVNFCSVPRSAQEILERIGVSNQTRTRKKYIQPLLDLGVLEMTIPDNPNDRNQKYRKVRKG